NSSVKSRRKRISPACLPMSTGPRMVNGFMPCASDPTKSKSQSRAFPRSSEDLPHRGVKTPHPISSTRTRPDTSFRHLLLCSSQGSMEPLVPVRSCEDFFRLEEFENDVHVTETPRRQGEDRIVAQHDLSPGRAGNVSDTDQSGRPRRRLDRSRD